MGSTLEDYFNTISSNLVKLEKVESFTGYLQEKPVSIFVGEMLSSKLFGLYAAFTLREPKLVLPGLRIEVGSKKAEGFTAMPIYSYVQLFRELQSKGIKEVHLGGSEIPDLNRFKRQFGCRNDPSYWALKLK